MFKTLRNAFKVKDIRDRILFTFLMLIVIRIGSELPAPGVDGEVFKQWWASQSADGLGFFNAITGGSFLNMSVFALNITPYITSSIIIQLLTIAIPKLEEIQRDGEEGRKKMVALTRYVTIVLALIQSIAMTIGFYRGGYLTSQGPLAVIEVITGLTAGSAVLMWIGERITEKGIGNGISIVLVINIISRMPEDMGTLWSQFIANKSIPKGIVAGLIIIAIIVAMVVFVVVLQDAERRIPVQYSKKLQGRKQVGGQSTHIPLKVNTGGVIPVIFAQSLLQTPVIIAAILGKGNGTGIGSKILKGMSQSNWCNPEEPIYSIGLVVYILLIIAFAYFYTQITFNPLEIANNMKKAGGFIPGIRPGKPTSDYLNQILNYIVFIGAVGLSIVAFIPIFFNGVFKADVSFGGTSIIIIVGVVIETLKQVESQMRVRYYKGFLND
ncbi:MAG: preprotein translocase subunit SecY [Lachnobacterium sp.]|nr:preprotein translocase subunit SecY [Roseburia faecis]MCI7491307.1 preprotein translocase subunit SecY [Lachnobacterium sp.]MDY4477729.1 preprotein translocase subunit SecY [Roseburia faecis]